METVIFDWTYRGLALALAVLLVGACAVSARSILVGAAGWARNGSVGLLLAGLGLLASLVVGVGLQAARPVTGDVAYQVVHFAVFYAGFALVLLGSARLAGPGRPDGSSPAARSSRTRWLIGAVLFAAVTAFSSWRLVQGALTASGAGGAMRQEVSFFLPVLLSLVLAAAVAASGAIRSTGARQRACWWFTAFAGLILVGFLREASILPSLEPLVDLLAAFGPFVLGGAAVYRAARVTAAGS